jgi:hypothetical protein
LHLSGTSILNNGKRLVILLLSGNDTRALHHMIPIYTIKLQVQITSYVIDYVLRKVTGPNASVPAASNLGILGRDQDVCVTCLSSVVPATG